MFSKVGKGVYDGAAWYGSPWHRGIVAEIVCTSSGVCHNGRT